MKAPTTTNITHNSTKNEVKGKVEKKSGKRIGYNYIIIKSLKESQKNDVVKCLYIKSLTNFGFCVIKEGTFGDSKDKEGRDIKDRLIWQKQLHELLQDKVRMPRLLGSFEENGNYYLVIECIKGKSLGSLCKKHSKILREGLLSGNKLGIRFLNYLLQIVDILETLHQNNVVHRDATSNNFMITPGGKVAVIDFELSYSLQQEPPSPPFQLGTFGYMSPQQIATQTPTIQEDIFSVGAILLQVWTNISPNKLTDAPINELEDKVYFFIPDQQIGNIIIQCLQPQPGDRPALATVRGIVHQYKSDLLKKVNRPASKPVLFSKEDILDTIQQALGTLGSPILADAEMGWFAEDMKKQDNGDKNRINKAWHASYNTGAAGIIYLLSKIKMAGFNVDATLPYVQKGLDLISRKYIDSSISPSPGLHFGAAGIAASLTTAIEYGLIQATPKYWDWVNKLLERENNELGILHGIAGQGIANLICTASIGSQVVNERLQYYARHLLARQERDGSWLHSVNDKKKRIIRGFARGMAGIVYFLLEYAQHFNDKLALAGAERGLQWLMKKAEHKKGIVQWRSANGKEIPPWWSEGAAGIALPFLKAWSLLKEPRYQQYAIGALNNHPEKVVDNNLSQASGLSGLGEIYLEAYQVLQDEIWLKRACWIAQVLLHSKKQHPKYGPYWLVEHERQPVPGFMTGNSGVLHFLIRYCYPDKINFPLMPGEKRRGALSEFYQTALLTSQSQIV
jgi:serine/threonine protein kinase